MQQRGKALWLTVSLFFLTAATVANARVSSLPYYSSADFTPQWFETDSVELQNFHRVPAFRFINQSGEQVTDITVEGDIVIANFFFSTCPGICPRIRSKLAKVQEQFIHDDSVTILSHSIRPTTDTVAVLQQYAKDNGIVSDNWHLLTGDKNTIYALARNTYFANEDLGKVSKSSDFLHTENLMLVDKNKHIRGVYNGLSASSVQHLIEDIRTLQHEQDDLPLASCHEESDESVATTLSSTH